MGRYARKDKRPLDPPPVVVMRLYQVAHARTPHEQVQEFADLEYVWMRLFPDERTVRS